jgi:hypothetical protein
MPAVHRHSDARSCGATTVVSGQSNVFANSLLIAVNDDPNTHGNGKLIAGSKAVFINNKLVVNNTPDSAKADDKCPKDGGEHCAPKTAAGSPNVFTGD